MKSKITIPLLTMAAATNALGCYSTWDLKPEMVVKLDGFSGAPRKIEVDDDGEKKEIEFTSKTYLHFHDSRGQEISAQFHALRLQGPVLVGIEEESGERLNVDLRGIRLIQASNLSPAKTTIAALGYAAGLVPVIGGLAFGIYFTFDLNPSGRPLRVSAEAAPTLAPLIFKRNAKIRKRHSDSDEAIRMKSFVHWAREASAECASVPAFLALARDLTKARAPTNMVQAALRAAREEITHTLLCIEMANEHAEFPVEVVVPPLPMAQDATPQGLLERLVFEAFWDGCVAEGAAAAMARKTLTSTKHKAARFALKRIAQDEQSHADLARDILAYGLSINGRSLRNKLAESFEMRRQVEEKRLDERIASSADEDALTERGLPREKAKREAQIETWEKNVSMLRTMGCA